MLTDREIKRLSDYIIAIASDIFVTKAEFNELLAEVRRTLTVVDGYSKQMKDFNEEFTATKYKVYDTMEPWIEKAAIKIDVDYEP